MEGSALGLPEDDGRAIRDVQRRLHRHRSWPRHNDGTGSPRSLFPFNPTTGNKTVLHRACDREIRVAPPEDAGVTGHGTHAPCPAPFAMPGLFMIKVSV
jgi:hypothetical protein